MNLPTKFTLPMNRAGLLLEKHSPELMLGGGILGVIFSTVLACKATLDAQTVIGMHKDEVAIIDEYHLDQLDGNPRKRELLKNNLITAFSISKLYLPAAMVGIGAIALITGSHHILTTRNAALAAAYKLAAEAYQNYRRRVVEEFGEETDVYLRTRKPVGGLKIVNEKGKTPDLKKAEQAVIPQGQSLYARWFDNSSLQWREDPDSNLTFLMAQQSYANDMLQSRGHVFLNQIYEALGIPSSREGAIVGWVLGGDGDNAVDFGLYDPDVDENADFINGYQTKRIFLDFNVDGTIWDKI